MDQTRPARPDDDAALLTAHRRGDAWAFASLMSRYDTRLRGMCWRYLRDTDTVDDVLQETFCHVLEQVNRVDDTLNVGAWIHRIAANLCIDELRRRARRTRTHVSEGNHEAIVTGILDEDRRGRPEEALELDVTRSLVRAAILQLPERQRDVLVLRDLCGMSEAVAATSLGLSPSAVQGILHRARERFKSAYIALESDECLPGECGHVAFIFQHLRLRSLRKDRLKAVERHLNDCSWCHVRFSGQLQRAAEAASAAQQPVEQRAAA